MQTSTTPATASAALAASSRPLMRRPVAAFATSRPRSVLVDGEPVAFGFDRDATGATGEVCGGRVLVPLGPREDTHEVRMRFEE